jgi:HD-GYP domain-containing protein (c-di-GMP phosphodiesterase class II)
LLDHSSQEILGRSGLNDVHPDDLKSVREILARLVSEPGSTQRLEYRLRHKDGTWRWIDTFATNSLHVPAVHGIVLNSRDITERKQAELKIQEQLERLTALSEVDQAIASRSDVQVSLNLLLSRAIHLLAVDAAAVLLLDPFRNILEYKAEIGIHMNATQNASVTLRTRLAERVALEGRMVEFRSGSNEPENQQLADYLRRENFASYHGAPLVVKGKVIGVLEVFSRLLVERDQDWLGFFGALAGHIAIMVDSAKLFNDLQASNLELSLAYDATLEGWSRALEMRDRETSGHSHRVTETTLRLAKAMGVNETDLVHIHRGALLHDIGKLGIPDSVLLKPGPLNDEEKKMIQKHPTIAFEMLAPIAHLRPALDIPYSHHEKWDGSGYPLGLIGENIPLSARIFAVVDVWDALTSDRPYQKAWPVAEVLAYIREQSGKHFDPEVVDAFLSVLDDGKANGEDTKVSAETSSNLRINRLFGNFRGRYPDLGV